MEKVKSIKFKYDGQDCKVKLVYRGQTTIALVIIGKEAMTGLDRCERVYCGISSCHPTDDYDVQMGIKLACRNALNIDDHKLFCDDGDVRNAAIYREIRIALNPYPWGKTETKETPELPHMPGCKLTVETVFEEEKEA